MSTHFNEIQLIENGEIIIKAKVGDVELNNRTITVKLGEIDFSICVIFRYNPNKKEYEILKNGTIKKNYEIEYNLKKNMEKKLNILQSYN